MEKSRAAVIFGVKDYTLNQEEISFFKDIQPWGFILFKRNCTNSAQIKALINELHDTVGYKAPIMIDQEGGRVARLSTLEFNQYPSARFFGDMHKENPNKAIEACTLGARLIGLELKELGITINTIPVLDLSIEGAHSVIGDRAYSNDPNTVVELGFAAMDGLMSSRILPVMKHMPGHGRAMVDSHDALPIIKDNLETLEKDFWPFFKLAGAPCGMTAHIIYEALDSKRPASLSPIVIEKFIRNVIGFHGLLISDDLSMKALSAFGSIGFLAEQVLEAGCDIALHCNGNMDEMQDIANHITPLTEHALKRTLDALDFIDKPPLSVDTKELKNKFLSLIKS